MKEKKEKSVWTPVQKNMRSRLILMNFLQYAVWGAYLTAMGMYLGKASVGLGDKIWAFYTVQGIVSIFMPTLMGIVADRYIPAQKVLSLCHGVAGAAMIAASLYCLGSDMPSFGILFTIYTVSVAFYMPTIALSNSVGYSAIRGIGKSTDQDYPSIRSWGTIGFICAALTTQFAGLKETPYQFLFSGILGLALAAYALSLPNVPVKKGEGKQSLAEAFGFKAFSLFKDGQMAIFFIFSMLLGAALQVTNSYAGPFLQSFQGTYVADYSLGIVTLSQVAEACCILLIPFFLRKLGIKKVMLIALFAWVFRFGFLAIGGSDWHFVFIILSMIVYGFAFDFFNVSGSIYVDQQTEHMPDVKSSAQGLFMLMTNGLGASLGTFVAGMVVNSMVGDISKAENWPNAWWVFTPYALVIAVGFMILFKDPYKKAKKA